MRAPSEPSIPAPPLPTGLPWINVAPLRMDKQRGRPVLVEFWDFCQVSCLRTLPYLKAWHDRYAGAGLRVISVHCPGAEPSRDEDAVRAAVARLGIEHPVVIDGRFEIWEWFDPPGWPSRYLFNQELKLFEYHHGEGGYEETEAAIRELLGDDGDPVGLLRPEDDPEALLVVPTADVEGPYSGPYAAGGVWGVFSGHGTVTVNGLGMDLTEPGAYMLAFHERHTEAVLDMVVGEGVTCHATCFTPGLAPEGAEPTLGEDPAAGGDGPPAGP